MEHSFGGEDFGRAPLLSISLPPSLPLSLSLILSLPPPPSSLSPPPLSFSLPAAHAIPSLHTHAHTQALRRVGGWGAVDGANHVYSHTRTHPRTHAHARALNTYTHTRVHRRSDARAVGSSGTATTAAARWSRCGSFGQRPRRGRQRGGGGAAEVGGSHGDRSQGPV